MGYKFREDPNTHNLIPFPPVLLKLLRDECKLQDRDAYFNVRKILKKYKYNKYYKDTFQLIYEAGGKRPQLSHQDFDNCVRRFMMFQSKFIRFRENYHRHNLPCYYMILELILKQTGHEPFYHFPHLKDNYLEQKIFEIFSDVYNKK